MANAAEDNRSDSEASDSVSSDASTESAIHLMSDPATSQKIRHRMQPSCQQQPLWERQPCTCCGRNMRLEADSLTKFREFVRVWTENVLGEIKEFSESESTALLTDDFLSRLLVRCAGEFKPAFDRLIVARAVHRKFSMGSRAGSSLCQLCLDRPGFHSFRQVGFDRLGRPVLYTCLNQDKDTGTAPSLVHNYLRHLICIVREAEKTIPEDQHTLVMVFDTTGLGANHVRVDTVFQFGEILKYFPARICYALLLNMSSLTKVILKPVIHLTEHQDDVVIVSRRKMEPQLAECFSPDLVRWLLAEVERNKQPKVPFCSGPSEEGQHDPRGVASYVQSYVVKQHPSGHRPHPSLGCLNKLTTG